MPFNDFDENYRSCGPSRFSEYAGISPMDRDPAEYIQSKCEKCNEEFESSSDLKKQFCRNIEHEHWMERFKAGEASECKDYYLYKIPVNTPFVCHRCEDKGYIFDHFFFGYRRDGLHIKRSCPNCQKEYWRETSEELGYEVEGNVKNNERI